MTTEEKASFHKELQLWYDQWTERNGSSEGDLA